MISFYMFALLLLLPFTMWHGKVCAFDGPFRDGYNRYIPTNYLYFSEIAPKTKTVRFLNIRTLEMCKCECVCLYVFIHFRLHFRQFFSSSAAAASFLLFRFQVRYSPPHTHTYRAQSLFHPNKLTQTLMILMLSIKLLRPSVNKNGTAYTFGCV